MKMEKQKSSTIQEPDQQNLDQGHFKYYARPLTVKLLETMELSKHYFHGEGDYLYYEMNKKVHKVLDLTGGYGANILGHKNPQVMAKLKAWHDRGSPSLSQGSIRQETGKLTKKISDTLYQETSEGPWVTTLSNSGTEAVEAAYKHCLIYFKHKLIEISQQVQKEMNLALIRIKSGDEASQAKTTLKLRLELTKSITSLKMSEERKSYFLHQLGNTLTIDELINLIREINEKQLSQKPKLISLEKSYHGKSMGSLSLTSSETFRSPFYLDDANNESTIFVSQYIDHKELDELIQRTKVDLVVLSDTNSGFKWTKQPISTIAGIFIEPIQGEAGIIPVNYTFLAIMKKYSLQENFLLVFDEIQTGIYRTGKFAAGNHSSITADIYIFSKSLGGGIAKIGATAVIQRKYIEDFGFLHTSTFSEDDFSSSIGLEVLNILQAENSPVKEGMKTADYLLARLENLKEKFPTIVKEIRGQGLMLAIEFHDIFREFGFEFKSICDAKMQGYMMSSVLLNHEDLRMNPSLSNNLTLRIQPSLYFTIIQAEHLISGLTNMCVAMKAKRIDYFLSSIYPDQEIINRTTSDIISHFTPSDRPLAVFLCHLIDENHLKKVTFSLKGIEGERLMHKLALSKDIAEFEIYHAQTMIDNNGVEIDIVLLAIPVTSEELKKTFTSKQKYKIVEKIQHAVDYSKDLGATTVGLGQFTSIVSGNGLYLNPKGMNLTTGNAFTIALTVQAALRSARDKNLDFASTSVALIGAAGNIMSVATSLMADHVGKIQMIHHSPIETSFKYQESTKKILEEIKNSSSNSNVCQTIKKYWQNDLDLLTFLAIPEVARVFTAGSDVSKISESDIVLCGASAANGFLSIEMFKENAIVVDIAVPASINQNMLNKLRKERPDITYHLGGTAQIPKDQSVECLAFPLEKNECYACMAETFSLGFSGKKNFLNIGDLNKKIVLEVQDIALRVGFNLGSYKEKNSL